MTSVLFVLCASSGERAGSQRGEAGLREGADAAARAVRGATVSAAERAAQETATERRRRRDVLATGCRCFQ